MPQRPHTIKLSPDERFLYVLGESKLAVFAIVPGATATDAPNLQFVQAIDNDSVQSLPRTNDKFFSGRFDSPTDLIFNADSTQALVTDAGSEDGIIVFERSKSDGRITSVTQKLRKENSFGKSVDVGNEPTVKQNSRANGLFGAIHVLDEPYVQPINGRGTYSFYARTFGEQTNPVVEGTRSKITPLLLRPQRTMTIPTPRNCNSRSSQ